MRRERASDRSRSAYDRSVDCIHSSDPGCHTWRRAHLDGSDESSVCVCSFHYTSRAPDDSAAPIPHERVNFTDTLGLFHPGSVAGVGLFKVGRLGHSLAYIRSSFHLVSLSQYCMGLLLPRFKRLVAPHV